MLSRITVRREVGQVVVLFALLVPVILTIGSIVVSAGNWYVLKRHLQTQVDTAALAGGQGFVGCGQDPATTDAIVSTTALKFSGDTLRSRDQPLGPLTTPYNLQLEDAGDQRVVLNSTSYWPSAGNQTDGSSYDYTDVSTAADAPKLGVPGGPCYNGYLDVKVTDHNAPLLFRWIPLFPSPKSRARVELRDLQGGEGLRPIGVPEVDPAVVAVLIVNENAAGGVTSPGAIVNPPAQRILDEQSTLPAGLSGMHVWSKSLTGIDLGGGSQDFRAVIVTSRDPAFAATGSLDSICTDNPTQTFCYTYDGSLSGGISFIHSYNGGGTGTADVPIVRDVTLAGGCGVGSASPARDSNPYFNVDDGTTCSGIGISATIDFGTGGADPTQPVASGGVCAEVSASPGGNMIYAGGVWTAAFTPAIGSGSNPIDLTTTTDTTGNCSGGNNPSDTFDKVGNPYVADEASGPVQYLLLEDTDTGLVANSINKTTNASIKVTVGFAPLLEEADPGDPPIPLRIWNTPSQSRTLDCQTSGASGWADAMQFGCVAYQIYNQAWHTTGCGPPPSGVPPADPPDCIPSQNGNYQQSVATDMWASPCSDTPNNWYTLAHPTEPEPNDPRWIPLFIVDEKSFLVGGKKYFPVRRFGGFYVTAGSGINCPGDDPDPLPAGTKRTIYGHFVTYLPQTGGEIIPAAQLCTFTEGGVCVPVLVE
jgi:hypothetical protein